MHIPDGYLSPSTCASFYCLSAPFWYTASVRLKRVWNTQTIPLLSVFAAFSFVVMMFNLPLPGGTTGHAVGVSVATIVLGPWAGMLAVSLALTVQAVFFGDGGITAIGANCFNMAIAGSLVSYCVYRAAAGRSPLTSRRRVWAAAIAGYAAINAAAFIAALEFGLQPLLFHDALGAPLYAPYPLGIAIPAMMIGHLTIAGAAEMVVTAGIVAYLQRTNPGLLRATAPGAPESGSAEPRPVNMRKLILAFALLLILTPLGILAAGTAWGEWQASDFANPETRREIAAASRNTPAPELPPAGLERLSRLWTAPLPGYAPAFIRSAGFGYFVSASAGSALILLLGLLMSKLRFPGSSAFLERTVASFLAGTEHAFFADQLARRDGLLQGLDPRVKMTGLFALVMATVAVQKLGAIAALLTIAILLGLASGAGWRILAGRIWLPVLGFTGIIAIPAIFTVPGDTLLRLPVTGWTIGAQGIHSAALLSLRAATAATFSVLLVLCTPWNQVLKALRFFRMPAVLVVTLGMTYRYIFVLLNSAHDMFISRQSRMVGSLDSAQRRRVATASAGVLLARSLQLSAETHLAMQSRGFAGEVYVLDDLRVKARGWIALAVFLGIAAAALWWGR